MFAKQAQFAVAALALSVAGGAFAQSSDRNVFDSEAILAQPAAVSSSNLTREAVQAEYIAKRNAENISSFNPESYYFKQIAGSGSGFVALFQGQRNTPVATNGVTREQVRAEVLAARANGQLNPFDTETDLRVPASNSRVAPTSYAQR